MKKIDLVSGYKGFVGLVLGNENSTSSEDSYVERLLDCISNGQLAEDRRNAMADLQSVVAESHAAQLAFGEMGFPVLLGVLRERDDVEMVRGALETLVSALTPIGHAKLNANEVQPALMNTDLLSRDGQSISLLLSLLGEDDFYIRYYTLQLLTALLTNSPIRLQEAILTIPRGITSLMDMLMDREVIRNEALLLLTYLTREAEVKFGETLRRFTATIHNEKLALDVLALRAKIRSLLNFTPDADFTLTYLDEDGDVVTLADDDDIHDVVRQSLNPLRITVTLNNGNPSFSSGTSTPMQSPQTQFPLPPALSEFLKSVPEPLRDQLTTLPLELASKATSSSPVFTELMEKMKSLLSESMAAQRTKTSKPVVDPEAESSNSKVQKMSEGVKSVDLNLPYMEYEPFPAPVTGKNKDTTDSVEKKKDSDVSFANPIDYLKQYVKESKAANTGGVLPPSNDSGNSSGWSQAMLNTTSNCPFSGIPYSMDTNVHYHHPSRGHHHWKKHSNAIGNVVFHRGVRCDGCGVHPITGPRFKSKVKEDYDLCNVCFTGMGNTSDYIRMDRPSNTMRHPMPFRGLQNLGIPTPTLPHALRAPGSKLPRSKLDSRFILDVNILDGTIMAPFTEFTKIWRMRNNGTVIWPRGSQLQWIGGDRLSDSVSVDIEIPGDGLVVEKELDVAVDFRAPELPGRYISYWRMATSSGQKFGQRVWVLIQVDASMKDLGETSINLNLPPPVKSSPEVAVVTQDPLMDSILGGGNHEEPKDEDMNFPINDSLIIDNNGGSAATSPVVVSDNVATSPVVPPLFFGTEQVEAALASMDNVVYPTVETSEVAVPPSVVEAANEREEGLVQELVSMGFSQVELNKEILRMNNYDLEKSVDDLCGVSEWDPMLEELQEMGFADEEANRRLLKKNNGSIKRVVMDLINGEKA